MSANTAILFFSRLPDQEVLCKKMGENDRNSIAVFTYLYNKTLATAKKTNLPIIISDEAVQNGNTFAEKLTNSISSAFSNGYQNLIVIGSDTPNLSTSHLNFANNELQSGKQVVAGKDMRGGIYLLAINKSSFDENAFLQFSWQTNKLFKELQSFARCLAFSCLSSFLYDINSKADALRSLSLFYTKNTLRLILVQLSALLQIITCKEFTRIKYPVTVQQNILRGPPSRL